MEVLRVEGHHQHVVRHRASRGMPTRVPSAPEGVPRLEGQERAQNDHERAGAGAAKHHGRSQDSPPGSQRRRARGAAPLLPHPLRAARGGRPARLVVRALRRPVRRAPDGAAPRQGARAAAERRGRHADVRVKPGRDGADAQARRRDPRARVRARVGAPRGRPLPQQQIGTQ